MKKAEYILKYLLVNKLLSPFCVALDVDYRYIHGVATKHYAASLNVQKALSPAILPTYWYQDADQKFCKMIKKEISTLFIHKVLKDI